MVPQKPARAALTAACTLLIAACTARDAIAPASPDVSPALARGGSGGEGGSTVGYTVIDIGTLPGHSSAVAEAVNDAGMVVGFSNGATVGGAFLWHNNVMTALTVSEVHSAAFDVSNGGTVFVVGHRAVEGNSRGVRWRVEGSPFNVIEELDVAADVGFPKGVNDFGDIIGRRIRLADGTIIVPTLPDGFTSASGVDINNARHSGFNLGSSSQPGRAALRLSSGKMILLPPPASMSGDTSVAGAISEAITDGSGRTVVYVAGKIQHSNVDCTPVRWIVDVNAGTVISTDTYSVNGSAWGANSLGQITGTYGSRWSVSAFLWSGSQFTSLPMPKGTNDGKGYGMSPAGRYVAGQGQKRLNRRAILWTAPQP